MVYMPYTIDTRSYIYHFKHHRKTSIYTREKKNKIKYRKQHLYESALAEELRNPPTAETLLVALLQELWWLSECHWNGKAWECSTSSPWPQPLLAGSCLSPVGIAPSTRSSRGGCLKAPSLAWWGQETAGTQHPPGCMRLLPCGIGVWPTGGWSRQCICNWFSPWRVRFTDVILLACKIGNRGRMQDTVSSHAACKQQHSYHASCLPTGTALTPVLTPEPLSLSFLFSKAQIVLVGADCPHIQSRHFSVTQEKKETQPNKITASCHGLIAFPPEKKKKAKISNALLVITFHTSNTKLYLNLMYGGLLNHKEQIYQTQ